MIQAAIESLELQEETKEESDEEEDDDEESGRLRFKTERKEGTIIRLSDVTRERRNIPETLGEVLSQWTILKSYNERKLKAGLPKLLEKSLMVKDRTVAF